METPKQIQIIKPEATVSHVIYQKFVAHVHRNNMKQLFKQSIELTVGIMVGVILIVPMQTLTLIQNTLKTHDFIVPKIITVLALFLGRKALARASVRVYARIRNMVPDQVLESKHMIDSIPADELTDYLMRNRHFKREGINGVRETFGLNMERFNNLANRLEKNGVLTRGENNSRILSAEWTRQALFDYLSGHEKSRDFKPSFRIHRLGDAGKVRLVQSEIKC